MSSCRILAFGVWAAFRLCLSAQSGGQLCGKVVDEHGIGLEGALVVPSGGGFVGWAETGSDGSFCSKYAGAFISVRYAGFNPVLTRSSEVRSQGLVQLARADSAVRTLSRCQALPNEGRGWIGSGLRIEPPGHFKGPVNGEHDTHWYITIGKSTLNIVDGYAWQAGLPLESLLSASKNIDVRGWEFGNLVGLDLSGQLEDGRRWRWFGAPVAEAIGYDHAPPREAELFVRILDTVCYQGR